MRPTQPSRHLGQPHHEKVQEQLYKILRQGISFGDGTNSDNIDGVFAATTTPGVANTELAITHTLQRVPVGFDIKKKDAICDIYASATPWTKTQIFIKATGINVHILLFIH